VLKLVLASLMGGTYLTGVSVLKKMTVSLMSAVIIDDISC